ncbi:hypothetical protein KFK09_016903 [Dendrobium nobile]|uniref:Uncharacterized protein n=1 Tax=Dendrobium nobile TaxID=94219 RepID=A0A8T3B1E4_DENNO|nr:hypothetical protein KFK09_016903 [Dendrobium nobile]
MALDMEGLLLTTKLFLKSNYSYVASITLFVALLRKCIVNGHLPDEIRWMIESITSLFFVKFF